MTSKTQKWQVIRPPLAARFHLPTKDDLFHVNSGDSVKLIFQAGDDNAERMWVQVEQCGDSDDWTGRLDNDPAQEYTASVLKYEDLIHFHPFDVIDIDKGDQPIQQPNIEQIIDQKLSEVTNTVRIKWYKDPRIVVPAIIGLLTIAATVIVALI